MRKYVHVLTIACCMINKTKTRKISCVLNVLAPTIQTEDWVFNKGKKCNFQCDTKFCYYS